MSSTSRSSSNAQFKHVFQNGNGAQKKNNKVTWLIIYLSKKKIYLNNVCNVYDRMLAYK